MAVGDELVQIFQSDVVPHQNDLVIGLQLFDIDFLRLGVQVGEQRCFLGLDEPAHQFLIDFRQHLRIICSTVMIELAELQRLCHAVQLMAGHVGQHRLAQNQGIQCGKRKVNVVALADIADKCGVESGVVRHQYRILSAEFHELPECLFLLGRVLHHGIGNAGQLHDILRDFALRIDHDAEGIHHLHSPHFHCANFRQTVVSGTESGGLHVEDDDLILQCAIPRLVDDKLAIQIVDHICLAAENHLEVLVLEPTPCVHRIRKCLCDTVVGDGDRRMPPFVGTLHQLGTGRDSIHLRHIGMAMQLHTLYRCVVHLPLPLDHDNGVRFQHVLPGE